MTQYVLGNNRFFQDVKTLLTGVQYPHVRNSLSVPREEKGPRMLSLTNHECKCVTDAMCLLNDANHTDFNANTDTYLVSDVCFLSLLTAVMVLVPGSKTFEDIHGRCAQSAELLAMLHPACAHYQILSLLYQVAAKTLQTPRERYVNPAKALRQRQSFGSYEEIETILLAIPEEVW